MPVAAANPKESLFAPLSKVFDQAQNSTANHRKNFVALYKLHKSAVDYTDDGSSKATGERVFGDMFFDMVNRVISVKKGQAPADRIVKFVGGYAKVLHEKSTSYSISNLSKLESPR
jgi:condensin complex subunit 3